MESSRNANNDPTKIPNYTEIPAHIETEEKLFQQNVIETTFSEVASPSKLKELKAEEIILAEPVQSKSDEQKSYIQSLKKQLTEMDLSDISLDKQCEILNKLMDQLLDTEGYLSPEHRAEMIAIANRTGGIYSCFFSTNMKCPPGIQEFFFNEQMQDLDTEARATDSMIDYFRNLYDSLKSKGFDLSTIYDSNMKVSMTDLPIKPQMVLRLLCYDSVVHGNYLNASFQDIPSLAECVQDYNFFMMRNFPKKTELIGSPEEKIRQLHVAAKIMPPASFIDKFNQAKYLTPSEDIVKRTIKDLFYKAAEKLIEDDPKSLTRTQLASLPLELIEEAAKRGNTQASICLLLFKYKPDLMNETSDIKQNILKHPFDTIALDQHIMQQLLELGENSVWDLYSSLYVKKNQLQPLLEAIQKHPSLWLSLKRNDILHPEIQQFLLTKLQNNDVEGLDIQFLSPQNITTDNTLGWIEHNGDISGFGIFEAVENDPRLPPIIEEKLRQGKLGYYRLLKDKKNRDLLMAAIKANPRIYEELLDEECRRLKIDLIDQDPLLVDQTMQNPLLADQTMVREYLKAFPWKTELVFILLGQPAWMKTAIAYAKIVLASDKYLTLDEDIDAKTKRFYDIAQRLPLDLQAVITARASGSNKSTISGDDVKWAVPFILMLAEQHKVPKAGDFPKLDTLEKYTANAQRQGLTDEEKGHIALRARIRKVEDAYGYGYKIENAAKTSMLDDKIFLANHELSKKEYEDYLIHAREDDLSERNIEDLDKLLNDDGWPCVIM